MRLFIYTFSHTRIGGIETFNSNVLREGLFDECLSIYEMKLPKYLLFFKLIFLLLKADSVVLSHINLYPLAVIRFLMFKGKSKLIIHGKEVWQKLPYMALVSCVFIPVSSYTRNTVISRNSRNKISFGHNLYNCYSYDGTLHSHNIFTDDLNEILTVSRLDASDNYKGIDQIIKSVKILNDLDVKVRLKIVGSGNDLPRLKAIVEELELGCVDFLGFVDDLVSQYQSNRIFILPSSGEGFGIVFLEAMSAGMNIIALDKGAPFQFLKSYSGFFSVENQDESTLALAIRCALVNRKIEVNKLSSVRILEKYNYENFKINSRRAIV